MCWWWHKSSNTFLFIIFCGCHKKLNLTQFAFTRFFFLWPLFPSHTFAHDLTLFLLTQRYENANRIISLFALLLLPILFLVFFRLFFFLILLTRQQNAHFLLPWTDNHLFSIPKLINIIVAIRFRVLFSLMPVIFSRKCKNIKIKSNKTHNPLLVVCECTDSLSVFVCRLANYFVCSAIEINEEPSTRANRMAHLRFVCFVNVDSVLLIYIYFLFFAR